MSGGPSRGGEVQGKAISRRAAIDKVAKQVADNSRGRVSQQQAREMVRKDVLRHERNESNGHR